MQLVRSALVYAFAAAMIVGAYHAGAAFAGSLLTSSSHVMGPSSLRPVSITAEMAERVA